MKGAFHLISWEVYQETNPITDIISTQPDCDDYHIFPHFFHSLSSASNFLAPLQLLQPALGLLDGGGVVSGMLG